MKRVHLSSSPAPIAQSTGGDFAIGAGRERPHACVLLHVKPAHDIMRALCMEYIYI